MATAAQAALLVQLATLVVALVEALQLDILEVLLFIRERMEITADLLLVDYTPVEEGGVALAVQPRQIALPIMVAMVVLESRIPLLERPLFIVEAAEALLRTELPPEDLAELAQMAEMATTNPQAQAALLVQQIQEMVAEESTQVEPPIQAVQVMSLS